MELTLQEYAIKTKQSLYSVIKQVNSAKLNSYKKEKDGKTVEFIFVDDIQAPLTKKSTTNEVKIVDYEQEYHKLLQKYNELLSKCEKLSKK